MKVIHKIVRIFFPIITLALAALATALAIPPSATAQTASPGNQPQFFITWQSRTYVPPAFSGKILPTANSLIAASFELIDAGKPADLSKKAVYWYVNNNFLQGGDGLQHVQFRAPDAVGATIDLRIEVPNYKGASPLKTIEIPVVAPEAVIEAPFPNHEFSISPVQFVGRPYFFNVRGASGLNLGWTVNGQTPAAAENPERLNVGFTANGVSGPLLTIGLNIQNSANVLESAAKHIELTHKP